MTLNTTKHHVTGSATKFLSYFMIYLSVILSCLQSDLLLALLATLLRALLLYDEHRIKLTEDNYVLSIFFFSFIDHIIAM